MFRRNKFNFSEPKDDRIKIINERINLAEKHLLSLCTTFSAMARKSASQRDIYDDLARCFLNYSDDEDINENMSEGMKNFTTALTLLGDYMDQNVHRMEMKIVNELVQMENLCKSTRDSLRIAIAARDKEMVKERHLIDIKSKFAANNTAADSELIKAKLEVNRTNKEINEIIFNFEKRKLSNIKDVLNNFILIAMKYHTKSLEALTASYYDISNINDKADCTEFQKLMKSKDTTNNRKVLTKKSKSMDNLDKNDGASNLKKNAKLFQSQKDLSRSTESQDDEDDEDDEEEEDDDDDGEEEEENSEIEEEDSGSQSEQEDSASEIKDITKRKSTTNKQKPLVTSAKKSHPFKANNARL